MTDFITDYTEMIKSHTAEFHVLIDSLTQKSVEMMEGETDKCKKFREEFEIPLGKNQQSKFF